MDQLAAIKDPCKQQTAGSPNHQLKKTQKPSRPHYCTISKILLNKTNNIPYLHLHTTCDPILQKYFFCVTVPLNACSRPHSYYIWYFRVESCVFWHIFFTHICLLAHFLYKICQIGISNICKHKYRPYYVDLLYHELS